jgi:dimethylhistidine N-methyltransferase
MQTAQLASQIDARLPAALRAAYAPRHIPRINSPFARDVLAGLSRPQKSIPCTWLYDHRGSVLFEQITQLDEYYPTRTEIAILERCVGQICAAVGPGATLVELGSGSSRKTPIMLAALDAPTAYVPIDISAEYLADSIRAQRAAFPNLPMHPIIGDIGAAATLLPLRRSPSALARAARSTRPWGRRLGFFPGSTIGHFAPDVAVALLERLGQALGDDSMLVVGVDSTLDRAALIPAYDDREGVTAAFNKNLLVRVNRELEGDFEPDAFRHEARFDAAKQRVEMHLVSKTWETFEVLGRRFGFPAGDSIHTENSYKYSLNRFHAMAERAGWSPVQFWTDARSRFGVHVLERARSR